jgi:molybdenum cofactor cytidylyltransferase
MTDDVIGILLAAGHSRRFGAQNKLMQQLPDGMRIAVSSARHLTEALPFCIGVVRPQDEALQADLQAAGLRLAVCAEGNLEMAASLVTGVRQACALYPDARGFVIALADMPYIRPQTILEVGRRIAQGRGIVVPVFAGRRGHPVGFSMRFAADLLALEGDTGARKVLENHPAELMLLECEDPGVLMDIDTPWDLGAMPGT